MAATFQILVICRCIQQNITTMEDLVELISEETCSKPLASQILHEISDLGFCGFLAKSSNEIDTTISSLYDAIITHHNTFYESLVTFKHDQSDITLLKPFECRVWNHAHLIPFMFQFLDPKSLTNSSLVNTKWFINAFDKNSIYHLDLSELLDTLCCPKKCRINNIDNKRVYYSVFRRYSNVRSIFLSSIANEMKIDEITMDCLKLFKKIEIFKCEICHLTSKMSTMIETIIKNNKQCIKQFECEIMDSNGNVLLPEIPRMVNKHYKQTLLLCEIENINAKWCKHFKIFFNLKKLNSLIIKNLQFNGINMFEKDEIIESIGKKCKNLKYFKIINPNYDMLSLWKGICQNNKNENGNNIVFSFESGFDDSRIFSKTLLKFIIQNQLPIDNLTICEEDYGSDFLYKLLSLPHIQQSLKKLKIKANEQGFEKSVMINDIAIAKLATPKYNNKQDNDNNDDIFDSIKISPKLLLKFKNLSKLEIYNDSIQTINLEPIVTFLQYIGDYIEEFDKLFLLKLSFVLIGKRKNQDDDSTFSTNFEFLCYAILQLFLLNVPIMLSLTFEECDEFRFSELDWYGKQWIYPFLISHETQFEEQYQLQLQSQSQQQSEYKFLKVPIVLLNHDKHRHICHFDVRNVS